jgi:tRNA pseudouridine38-40 synthase
MNYVIEIAYDGSKFYGFQRLNEEMSVQKALEEALTVINKQSVEVKGAGRTDRGVHANGQCVSFKLDIDIDTNGLKRALNSLLKPYIYVKDVRVVDENFHARFSVVKKKYIYRINLGEFNPQIEDYVYQSEYKLDVDKMKEVSKLYLGVHDFHNFVSGEREDSTCVVYNINFNQEDDILTIEFVGKSFYRYMVRNLVGMMIEVGRGKDTIDKVKRMLESEEDFNGFTAPANGLYLEKIEY